MKFQFNFGGGGGGNLFIVCFCLIDFFFKDRLSLYPRSLVSDLELTMETKSASCACFCLPGALIKGLFLS